MHLFIKRFFIIILGRPTIEKCKKLRKKIETKKEISELDLSNIIHTEGWYNYNV